MEVIEEKWEEILLTLKKEFDLSDLAFKSWIAPLKIDHIENNTLYIPCEEQITASYIAKKYSKPLSVVIEELTGNQKENPPQKPQSEVDAAVERIRRKLESMPKEQREALMNLIEKM